MDTKRELNDILINDEELQTQNRTKKLMMLVAIALVFLSVLVGAALIIFGENPKQEQIAIGDTSIQNNPDRLVEVPIDEKDNKVDPFAQIIEDIRKRNPEPQNNPTNNEPTSPTIATNEPILPTRTTTQNPVNPKPDSKPAVKPTQKPVVPNRTSETRPTQVAQNNVPSSPARLFDDTPTMDRTKNGQIAEKGHYAQIGSFAGKPSDEFMKKIDKYSYRLAKATTQNGTTTRYLIGPYKSRTEAGNDFPKYKEEFVLNKLVPDGPIHYEVK